MITKEKFKQLKKKYGDIASWTVWDLPGETPKSNMRNISFFSDEDILDVLNDKYVFVGLNGSGVHDEYMEAAPWCFFHSNNPHGQDFKLH